MKEKPASLMFRGVPYVRCRVCERATANLGGLCRRCVREVEALRGPRPALSLLAERREALRRVDRSLAA